MSTPTPVVPSSSPAARASLPPLPEHDANAGCSAPSARPRAVAGAAVAGLCRLACGGRSGGSVAGAAGPERAARTGAAGAGAGPASTFLAPGGRRRRAAVAGGGSRGAGGLPRAGALPALAAGPGGPAAPVLEEALVRVQQPPVRRLAEAAEAPTDREQWRELERYQAGLRARPPRSDRAGLMERVVAAEGKAELAALLQSCIEELLMSELAHRGLKPVRPAASEWPSLLARRIAYQQQQQQLYSFYAYRFIDNATLEGWLAAMAEGPVAEALATVLEVSRQTLAPPLP